MCHMRRRIHVSYEEEDTCVIGEREDRGEVLDGHATLLIFACRTCVCVRVCVCACLCLCVSSSRISSGQQQQQGMQGGLRM